MFLTKFSSREVAKQELKDFKPQNKTEAIKTIHMLSLLKSAEKEIKNSCYDFLTKRCADCANHIDSETGLEVVLVEPEVKVYNETEELSALLAEEKELKDKIKKAKEQAGFLTEAGTPYWKATGK